MMSMPDDSTNLVSLVSKSVTTTATTTSPIGARGTREDSKQKDENNNEIEVEVVRQSDQNDQKEPRAQSKPIAAASLTGQFLSVFFFGSIEHGYFVDKAINDVYFKYNIVYGPDWMLAAGLDCGISQISRRRLFIPEDSDRTGEFVWNLPVDCSFRSYNPNGWPQLVLSVYYFDTFGQDVILGYGCLHLPVTNRLPSMYKRKMIIYAPESSSLTRKLFSWLTGRKPELINSKLFANGDCRQALHMKSVGHIDIVMNATFKDMLTYGFRH